MVDRARVTSQAEELAAALADLERYRAVVSPGDLERDRDRRRGPHAARLKLRHVAGVLWSPLRQS